MTLGWLPPSGEARSPESVILPSIALGLLSMATFARVARTAILDELGKDYVRTARAKGVPPRRIFRRHLLRNSAIPVITVAALELAQPAGRRGDRGDRVRLARHRPGGESRRSAPRDFAVVQAVVLLGAFTAIGLNLLADILYSVVDPRIRLGGAAA